MTPPEDKIDPIQYAWGRCNHGMSLPAVLKAPEGEELLSDKYSEVVGGDEAAEYFEE